MTSLQVIGISTLQRLWTCSSYATGALDIKTLAKGRIGSGTQSCDDVTPGNAVRSLHRDQFSWTALISQYTKCGQGRQALEIYEEMRECKVTPSSYTYVAALKACSRLLDLKKANQIHAQVVESGLESDVYVGTMLVDAYTKCQSMVDAMCVFEKMPRRNIVVWNSIILGYAQTGQCDIAFQLYARMQQEGVVPNERTFVGALKACSTLATLVKGLEVDGEQVTNRTLEQVRAMHSDIVKSGSESNVYVGNMLVDVYAKSGSMVDARHVFERMPHRNVVCWTTMISAYIQMEQGEVALQLYARMQQEGVVPDERAFVAALKACSILVAYENKNHGISKPKCLDKVRGIHSDITKGKLESHVFVGTMLVDIYAKCRSLVDARHVFEKLPHRDVVSWNAMISGYAQMEEGKEALQLYTRMWQEGLIPNGQTFIGALKACSCFLAFDKGNDVDGNHVEDRCLEQVRAIHLDIVSVGFESDESVANMLVDLYAKSGSLVDARSVFEKMPHPDVVAWNAIILGYADRKEGDVALELYLRMQAEGLVPNERTLVAALKACSSLVGLEDGNTYDQKHGRKWCLEQVRGIHSAAVKAGYASDIYVGNILLDVYARCGSLVESRRVFDEMPQRNVVSWTAMILAYAHVEEGEVALALYEQMQHDGVSPDNRAFVGALKACSSLAALGNTVIKRDEVCVKTRSLPDVPVGNMPVVAYGKCDSQLDARDSRCLDHVREIHADIVKPA